MSDSVGNTIKVNGKRIEFYYSEGGSCRENDNLTKMICFHSRYRLGDEHDYRSQNYEGWAEMQKDIERNENVAIIRPLFMYDHSGVTISTSPFDCRWDSGQIGFVLVTKEQARENFGVKRISKKKLERIEKILDAEVETYDQELRGDVYGFVIYDENDEELDRCGGFYGTNFKENGMLDNVDREFVEAMKEAKDIF